MGTLGRGKNNKGEIPPLSTCPVEAELVQGESSTCAAGTKMKAIRYGRRVGLDKGHKSPEDLGNGLVKGEGPTPAPQELGS